ncbi:MAG: DUF3775 domain-containing protein [Kiloniellales bacterium]|jgi:hypothetical protein
MLNIDPVTVYLLILQAREFDDKDEPGEPDPDNSPAEEVLEEAMHYYADDPVAQQIKDTIDGMNDDEQAELVALTWVGRGDFGAAEWAEAVRTARERRSNPTSEYLLGTPMLGDYLEEGMTQLGVSVEDLEAASK